MFIENSGENKAWKEWMEKLEKKTNLIANAIAIFMSTLYLISIVFEKTM